MKSTKSLDYQVNQLGFRAVIISLITALISMFFPLDVPNGYEAEHADRLVWLVANREDFIVAWINQIVAMLSLSLVFLSTAWRVREVNPLLAIFSAITVTLSIMAFIIPKFIAVWTIPMLAETASSNSVNSEMADTLLQLLNVSAPFSLYTSFDFLGFWLYSVFAVLVAIPLFGSTLLSKVASVSAGLFGILFHIQLIALWMGEISAADVEASFLGVASLLLIVIIAMAVQFRQTLVAIEG